MCCGAVDFQEINDPEGYFVSVNLWKETMETSAVNCEEAGSERTMFCSQCGQKIGDSVKFCPYCGAPVKRIENGMDTDTFHIRETAEQGFNRFAEAVSSEIGEKGKTEIHLRDLFSQIFKKHSSEEAEGLFIYGTPKTTPAPKDIITTWPKPWLYSRVFLYLFLTEILLWLCVTVFQNFYSTAGMFFIGAMVVPFSGLIFFWEVNAPRNISIFTTMKIFFAGGAFSVVVTMIFYAVVGESANTQSLFGAMIIGIVEENGKMIISSRYLNKLKDKYILNGLLIGAAVGAGFAVIETAGYALASFLQGGGEYAANILLMRSMLALGGHISWTAVASAGYISALGDSKDGRGVWTNRKFYFFFFLVIIMHGLWDGVTVFGYLTMIILTLLILVVVLILISAGMRQVSRVVKAENEN